MAVVKTSDDARDLFRSFGERHGVSVSALLEAIARRLPTGSELTPNQSEVIADARAIDAERRRRD